MGASGLNAYLPAVSMALMSDSIEAVRELLAQKSTVDAVGDDEELLSTGLLDSVAVLGLVSGLEEQFGVQIDMEHLTEENFGSIRSIAALVDRLREEETAS